jgi:hypothetical protein
VIKKFPFDPFPDVNALDFTKDNKKEVTEDFVAENFKKCGWDVFTPIRDLGIDLIIKKYVCPSGDTSWNKIETEKDCETCGKPLELITRFIQIKTRAIDDEGKFGYTLKTRDFTTDPRHVFLLYSDTTQQFVIFPMYEYIYQRYQLTENEGYSPQGVASMRGENYKKNEYEITSNCKEKHHLHYSTWRFISDPNDTMTQRHVDVHGLESISTSQIEQNFEFLTEQIRECKLNIFYFYNYHQSSTRTELKDQQDIETLRNVILEKQTDNSNGNIQIIREANMINFIERNIDDETLLNSVEKAFIPFPLLKDKITEIIQQKRNDASSS